MNAGQNNYSRSQEHPQPHTLFTQQIFYLQCIYIHNINRILQGIISLCMHYDKIHTNMNVLYIKHLCECVFSTYIHTVSFTSTCPSLWKVVFFSQYCEVQTCNSINQSLISIQRILRHVSCLLINVIIRQILYYMLPLLCDVAPVLFSSDV